MEALVLIFIGLVTGFQLGSHQQKPDDIHTGEPTANKSDCVASPDAPRIANLEDPNAPVWILQTDHSLCDLATGKTVVVYDLHPPEGF